ncbi:MAG TPA: hypothetical protein VFZ66_25550 [Herpetosiphonaceae bacterium]
MSDSQPSGTLKHPGAQPAQPRGRPVGVMIIAALFVLYVVFMALTAVEAFQLLSAAGTSADARSNAQLALALALAQLPFYAVTAIGLWRLKEWGRYLALAFLALNVARFVVEALLAPVLVPSLMIALSRSVIPITLMLYLLHPSIRPVFRSR